MLRRTALMGVVNVTPDSFSDGGRYFEPAQAISHGVKLVEEGADIIDVGGESTRPGARPVSGREEVERVIPVIRGLRRELSAPISVDTYKADVAKAALDAGADMVNDISALRFDPAMAPLIAAEKVPVVLMHMRGTPRTMQRRPHYRDVVEEVREFLRDRIRFAVQAGVDLERIIVDPGIGFGKELEHNLALLRALPALADLGRPVLVGPSRKTFIGKILDVGPEERLEGSLAAAVAAVLGGASVIRTHDVKEARRAIRVADAMRFGGASPLTPHASPVRGKG
ncbi:MAG: dihydropteroate synthase [Deltaproteobacteria bacterium]|nr:dihydropteroate synthase [Deltaproteobacteria bacterium]MBI2209768.1 dihydropteroate synthase [Deltaproteobacteria bacterium]MBI2992478.1 dihydropteroate synthase [Deltaproteobacteria bacterium]MBI3061250.1 dihydropteroate synthase [Deltaproteobacteria bacterium]